MSGIDKACRAGALDALFAGRTALIVEDCPLLMLDLEHLLLSMGFSDVKLACDVASGLEIAAQCEIDVAVLEFKLRDGSVERLADALQANGAPLVIYSGHSPGAVMQRYPTAHFIAKPAREDEFMRHLAELFASDADTCDADCKFAPSQIVPDGAADCSHSKRPEFSADV
jgi:DNA-binding NtrC family response regulator